MDRRYLIAGAAVAAVGGVFLASKAFAGSTPSATWTPQHDGHVAINNRYRFVADGKGYGDDVLVPALQSVGWTNPTVLRTPPADWPKDSVTGPNLVFVEATWEGPPNYLLDDQYKGLWLKS